MTRDRSWDMGRTYKHTYVLRLLARTFYAKKRLLVADVRRIRCFEASRAHRGYLGYFVNFESIMYIRE